jgi:hypothetical protein
MPYTDTPPGGAFHGTSIKNPATYEALMRQGKTKAQAAAISNAALSKGHKRGRHRNKRGRRARRRN